MRTTALSLLNCVIRTFALPVFLFLLASASALHAAQIPKLFNTGVDDTGKTLPANTIDPHYKIVEIPEAVTVSSNAFTLTAGFPVGPWVAEGPGSRWIAPRANQSTGSPAGNYIYRTTFDLTGFDPTKASITGRWVSDNGGADIVLNGASQGLTNPGNFNGWTEANDFSITTGFVPGINTLDFVVNNAGSDVNPTGLRVEMRGTVELPSEAPSIVDQPRGGTVISGENLTLSVLANGTPPLTFEWQLNGKTVTGATESKLELTAISAAQGGDYAVIVRNAFGVKTSDSARVTVLEPIGGLFNTGVGNDGTVLADLELDPHYKIIVNPDGSRPDAFVQDSTVFPIVTGPWVANSDVSKWIGPRGETSQAAVGEYTYRLQFTLGDFDPATVSIFGRWSTDNPGLDILVNGASSKIANSVQFGGFTSFVLTNGFVSGTNTIDFRLRNDGAGYTGLRVDALRGGAVKKTVTGAEPPRIVVPPQSKVAFSGETVTLNVVADGTKPLSYQWALNGQNLAGATGTSMVLSNITLLQAGEYVVTVRNSAGSLPSAPAVITVLERIRGLFDTGVGADGKVLADGAIDPHYRLVTNAQDPNSSDAFVEDSTVFPIVAGPWVPNSEKSKWIGPQLNPVGSGGDYAYEIIFDFPSEVDLSTARLEGSWATDNVGMDIILNGASTGLQNNAQFGALTTFVITSGFKPGRNSIQFVINNGGTTENPTGLRVENLRLGNAPAVPPQILQQPAGQIALVRSSAAFCVTATGTTPLRFQWQKDGIDIHGATSPCYLIPETESSHAGRYSVLVSNAAGSTTSAPVDLRIVAPQGTDRIAIHSAARISNREFKINFNGPAGASYALQFSRDLVQWTLLAAGVFGSSTAEFIDAANVHSRFYRVALLSAPTQILLETAGAAMTVTDSPNNIRLPQDGSSISVPAGAFDVNAAVQLSAEPTTALLQEQYIDTTKIFDAGAAGTRLLRIRCPLPKNNLLLSMKPAAEFMTQLGPRFTPQLFVLLHSEDAEESFGFLEPLASTWNPATQSLTSDLPPSAFALGPDSSYEATVLLGSVPGNIATPSSHTAAPPAEHFRPRAVAPAPPACGLELFSPIAGTTPDQMRKIISSNYGPRGRGTHAGTDISSKKALEQNVGTTPPVIVPVADGYIRYLTWSSTYGLVVIVQHEGFQSLYAHLTPGSVPISTTYPTSDQVHASHTDNSAPATTHPWLQFTPDQFPVRGGVTPLGLMGNTGRSHGTHLHFEVAGNIYRQLNASIGRLNAVPCITKPSPGPTPPAFAIQDASTSEGHTGNTTLNFTVTLTPSSTQATTVNWSTAPESATSPEDYAHASGTITFHPGETQKQIQVSLVGDTAVEPDETFSVRLSTAINATVSTARATGTIRNDDFPPTLYSLAASSNPAQGGSVTLNPPGGRYPAGRQIRLTATQASGYRFVRWEGSASGTDNPVTIIMDADKTVVAQFEPTTTAQPSLTITAVTCVVLKRDNFSKTVQIVATGTATGPVGSTLAAGNYHFDDKLEGAGWTLDNQYPPTLDRATGQSETVSWQFRSGPILTVPTGQITFPLRATLRGPNGDLLAEKSVVPSTCP